MITMPVFEVSKGLLLRFAVNDPKSLFSSSNPLHVAMNRCLNTSFPESSESDACLAMISFSFPGIVLSLPAKMEPAAHDTVRLIM